MGDLGESWNVDSSSRARDDQRYNDCDYFSRFSHPPSFLRITMAHVQIPPATINVYEI